MDEGNAGSSAGGCQVSSAIAINGKRQPRLFLGSIYSGVGCCVDNELWLVLIYSSLYGIPVGYIERGAIEGYQLVFGISRLQRQPELPTCSGNQHAHSAAPSRRLSS